MRCLFWKWKSSISTHFWKFYLNTNLRYWSLHTIPCSWRVVWWVSHLGCSLQSGLGNHKDPESQMTPRLRQEPSGPHAYSQDICLDILVLGKEFAFTPEKFIGNYVWVSVLTWSPILCGNLENWEKKHLPFFRFSSQVSRWLKAGNFADWCFTMKSFKFIPRYDPCQPQSSR